MSTATKTMVKIRQDLKIKLEMVGRLCARTVWLKRGLIRRAIKELKGINDLVAQKKCQSTKTINLKRRVAKGISGCLRNSFRT